MKKYSCQMTRKEVRELYFGVICRKHIRQLLHGPKWLLLAALLALEWIAYPMLALGVVILMVVVLGLAIAGRYASLIRQLCQGARVIWAEDGMLKAETEEKQYSELLCDSIREIRITRSLLVLEFCLDSKTKWYPIPLGVFEDERERDGFVQSLRNPQTREENAVSEEGPRAQADGEESETWREESAGERAYFCQSFQVEEEDWIRIMTDATDAIEAGTLGVQKKVGLIWTGLGVVCLYFVCRLVWKVFAAEWIDWLALFAGVIFLMLLRNRLERTEKKISRRIREGAAWDACGSWEISVTEQGVRQSIQSRAGGSSITIPWENLLCMVETDAELFLFQRDKKHFTVLLKKHAESVEQIESLKALCGAKQVEVLPGKRKRYAPDWFLFILTVIALAGLVLAFSRVMFWGIGRDLIPESVPLEEQISVLRSFGFTIPEEMEQSLYEYEAEDEIISYVEDYPYTWLLTDLAWADEAEEWAEWFEDGPEVFWFDFEGWDISEDYIRILEGMRELSAGSILDDVENIREDTDNLDWEKGAGTVTVSLEWRAQEYSWEMDVEYDWIDEKVLGIYNGLLKREGVAERFYMTFDDGQGALVFYCTKEWASSFEDATGLDLEAYMVQKGW